MLGGWLTPALIRAGASVVALVRDGAPRSTLSSEGWLDRIATVRGSLTDAGLLQRTMAEYSVETVFHLGAQTLVGVAKADPTGTLEANVRGTWMLLEAARNCGGGRQGGGPQVIVASSDKAYGDFDNLPYRETDPLQGRYPYDVSKSCTDLITTMYARTYGLPAAIVRCGNLFGGGDLNFSRLIPGAVQSTYRGENFRIRSDGKFVRDFLYVEDAAAAYMLLAERLQSDPSLVGEAFNFGLGIKVTALEVVRKIIAMMGREDLPPTVLNEATAEIKEQYLDAGKALKLLGWKPRYGMDEGLRRTIEWYETFFKETAAESLGATPAGAAHS